MIPQDAILVWESLLVLFACIGLFLMSLWKKNELLTEDAWDRLYENFHVLKSMMALGFAALVLYLLAEFVDLIFLFSNPTELDGIYELFVSLHMLLLAAAVFAAIPLFFMVRGAENIC